MYIIPFNQRIKIRTAVFRRFLIWKNYQMISLFRNLAENKPAGRQKKPAAENLPVRKNPAANRFTRFCTYQHLFLKSVEKLLTILLISAYVYVDNRLY